ncbi:ATP-binding cassette sub-family F member 1 [Cardiosporidium cionae]|uniref:ATP-binding cassette sub-family F member 1 n=1 Tax=Cardiosporidium cionae TaxID=476202 RepID=A0ABQ7J7V4_9APIC|nr:ATP-binding cassette sub-family F member 1 [Cardiosporidium cionae]|eukprot:KAF8820051.1 ATP-binding cassette sub-family F member 1 [Cardiosporidium cionae]
MAESEIARIAEEIHRLIANQMDEETLQYVAGMIYEEGIDGLSPHSLNELIGPFFMDCNCAKDDGAAYTLCDTLLSALKQSQPLIHQDAGKEKHSVDVLKEGREAETSQFHVPVTMKDLISRNNPNGINLTRSSGCVRNGVGKSSLLRAIVRREIPGFQADMTIGCVEQELILTDGNVLQLVLDVDVERTALLKEMEILEKSIHSEDGGKRLVTIYDRLNEIDASKTYDQAIEILTGLGFSPKMQEQKVASLSGGERMRVVLARALLADPDLLLLDEPSNHLDLHAIAWLTNYLKNTTKTIIIVSHARQLLNDVCSEIIFFANKTLQYFKGNYDQYEESLATQLKVQHRQFEVQEQKKKHMQQFIDKFRYNAKRASLVQSRLKALNKLPNLEDVLNDPSTHFDFEDTFENISPPVLQLEGVCGVNGSGKSTLLSLLTGNIEPLTGRISRSSKLRIGLYTQQHVDQLDLTLTAVQQLQARYPEANLKDEEARNFLGRFGITKMLSLEPLYVLSGGQKSRVCIALMAYRKPNLLVKWDGCIYIDKL